jgi:uncharacterized protein with von Willebrand factor type A (vWA) domain
MAQSAEAEFRQFIEFGQLFDKTARLYLVYYLRHRFFPTELDLLHKLELPSDPAFAFMQAALDRIFDHHPLLQAGAGNQALANQVIHDTLAWMRKAQLKLKQDNPLQDEFQRLYSWKDRPLYMVAQTWYHLTNWLKEHYERAELDISFYEKHFDDAFRDLKGFQTRLQSMGLAEQEKLPIQAILYDLLAQWEGLLLAKSLQHELETLEEMTQSFASNLHAKVAEYLKMSELITPFTQQLGRFWDMSRGLWKQTNFDVLSQYALLLENETSVQKLADLLGRLRQAQTAISEEHFEENIASISYRTSFTEKAEIGGIHESDDLAYMLPSEAALLADADTQDLFLKRFAEKKLLTFQYQGKKPVVGFEVLTDRREKTRQKEKGPFILCVDVSGSMEGLPEQVAKVLSFAILKMAAQDQRKAYLISFSSGLQTLNLLNLEHSLNEVVAFLTMTFNGGTDIHPALSEAMRMLEQHDYKEADILVVSDFIMYELRADLVKRMEEEKRKGTQFHSLIVSEGTANPEVVALFDHFWVYQPSTKDIMRQIAQDLYQLEHS